MIYLSPIDRHVISQITDGATAVPDGRGGTVVTVHMYIPSSAHGASVVSSNFRYEVTDTSATRNGGVTLTLTLDVPTT
jgi:hypothetical protein